jgi:hypothetical protein
MSRWRGRSISILGWLFGPQVVFPVVAVAAVAIAGFAAELPFAVVGVLALVALGASLLVLYAGLLLLDRFRPLARVRAASDELGRIIDEGQALKEPPFGGEKPPFYEVKFWWESASDFVEGVFGRTERQSFMAPLKTDEWTPFRNNYNDVLDGRCDRLRELATTLRDASDPGTLIRVSKRRLRVLGHKQQEQATENPFQEAIEELTRAAEEEPEQPTGPRLEFVGHEEKRQRVIGTGDVGRFFVLLIKNTGSKTAKNVWAELTVETVDGVDIFGHPFKGRWANNPQPDADPQPTSASGARYTRVDIPPNGEPEPLDVFVYFQSERLPGEAFVWNNENLMQNGRGNDYRIDPPGPLVFVVKARVQADRDSDPVELTGKWEIHARIPGSDVEELSP